MFETAHNYRLCVCVLHTTSVCKKTPKLRVEALTLRNMDASVLFLITLYQMPQYTTSVITPWLNDFLNLGCR